MALFFFLGEQVQARMPLASYQGQFSPVASAGGFAHEAYGMEADALGHVYAIDDQFITIVYGETQMRMRIPVGFAHVLLAKTAFNDRLDIVMVRAEYRAAYAAASTQDSQWIRNIAEALRLILEHNRINTAEIRREVEIGENV